MTEYEVGKWNGWNGGSCPVHPETVVEVQLDTDRDIEKAKFWEWQHRHEGTYSDIIAFRVIKEHEEPREFWIVCGYAFPTEYEAKECKRVHRNDHYEIIHVKEVLK